MSLRNVFITLFRPLVLKSESQILQIIKWNTFMTNNMNFTTTGYAEKSVSYCRALTDLR